MKVIKSTVQYKVATEDEAKALVDAVQEKGATEGYEVAGYKIVRKQKKSKGEIIAEAYLVEITCKYGEFWGEDE